MSELLELFSNNILPVLLVASVGFTAQKLLKLDPRPLSQITFYVLSPALVFTLLVSGEIEGMQVLSIMAFASVVVLIVAGLSYLLGRAMGLENRRGAAFILSTSFMNAGNYGLSVNAFAFGEMGLAIASIYYVASLMMTNSLGVYVASIGSSNALQALKGLAKVPAVYAIPLALIFRALAVEIPLPIARPLELLSRATVPAMLLLLGMQIARAGFPPNRSLLSASVVLKLLVVPVIALLLAPVFGIEGLIRDVGILQSAMPTAVMGTIIATQYDGDVAFVAGAVLTTTLLSPLTLTPLMALLLN